MRTHLITGSPPIFHAAMKQQETANSAAKGLDEGARSNA
jgi:hypothetical protein